MAKENLNPKAVDLANYIDNLHQNGYGNVDPNIQVALAQGATGHPSHNSILDTVTNGLSSAWKSVGQFFHDPALSTAPTSAQHITDHFNNNGIALPSSNDIKQTQQFLIDQGYAPPGGKVDGAWAGDWNQSLWQQQFDAKTKPGVGTTSAKKAFGNIFNNMFISGALPLIVDSIKHLPADVIKAVEDAAQTYKIGFKTVSGNLSEADKKQMDSLVGFKKEISTLGTALTIASLASGAGEIKAGFTSAVEAGMKKGATSKASALVTDLGKEVAPKNKWLMNSLFPEIDNGMRRFAFTKALQNSPVTGFTNSINKVATSVFDGFQGARIVAATPYRLPIVGVVGQTGTTAAKLGLKQSLIGEGEKFLGDPNGPQAQTLDHLKPIAGNVGMALNLFQLGLHPGTYSAVPTTKATIGSIVEGGRQKIVDALQQNQVIAEWQRGTGADYKKIAAELANRGIDKSHLDIAISADLNQKSAYSAGLALWQEKVKANPALALEADTRDTFIKNISSQVLNDPSKLTEARNSYLLKKGQFSADLAKAMVNLKGDTTYRYANDFVSKVEADALYKQKVIPHLDSLIHAETMAKNLELATPPVPAAPEVIAQAETVLQEATAKEQSARAEAEKAGLVVKGVQKRVTVKDVSTGKATKEQLALQQTWDAASKELSNARGVLAQAKGEAKFTPITDKEAQALNENIAITKHGFMKNERQTAGDAQAKAMSFYKELEKIRPGFKAPEGIAPLGDWEKFIGDTAPKPTNTFNLPQSFDPARATQAELDLRHNVFEYLGAELNRNIKDLQYVPTKNLIDLVVERSHDLAGDVHVPFDAPQSLKDAIKELKQLGYKPVYGTDIGHTFITNALSPVEMGEAQAFASKAADKLGLNFEQIDPHISAQHSYAAMQNTVQDFINESKPGTLPVWGTKASYVLDFLQRSIKPDIPWIAEKGFNVSAGKITGRALHPIQGPKWDAEIKDVMKSQGLDKRAAKEAILKTLATPQGPQFWTRNQVIEALTAKDERNMISYINKKGNTVEVEAAGMSKKAASDFYYAMRKGLRSAPAYSEGANPFVKLVDSSFGLANIPLAINGRRILDLTGNLRPFLMTLRYQGSYRFAYLRAVKSALKGVTANVPFTLDAAGSLKALGPEKEAQAYAIRDAYLGANEIQRAVTDYVEQEFNGRDVYNVYNPRAIEARNLYYLHMDALANAGGDAKLVNKAEIMKRFDQIYSYGNRTAAEKTVNAFFFPFSFEKTVAREIGGHLLDDPASRLMVATAVAAYDADPMGVRTWMEKNAPLFHEAEKFNPFYHGIGVGQFGGIMRMPYEVAKATFVNMLQPKPITTVESAKATLALIPALRDLNTILGGVDVNGKKPIQIGGELGQSAKALTWEAGSWISRLEGKKQSEWNPKKQLSYDSQQTDGWDFRSYLLTQASTVLLANQHGANYQWPKDIPRVGGQKVTSETVGQLVNHVYPSWDPGKILEAVAKNKTAIGQQREMIQNAANRDSRPDYLDAYDGFIKYADQVTSLVSKSKPDPAKLAEAQNWIRTNAVKLSMVDGTFAAFYKKYFQAKFGPLEGIK